MKQFFNAGLKISVLMLCLFPATSHAEGTFTQVHQLLQANCAGSGCHDGGNAALFNVNLPDTAFYNSIVNVAANNPAATAKFNKLVIPGDVQRSFLLRKMAHNISSGLALTYPAEGLDMPSGLPQLDSNEIELVRQWILFGAPLGGDVVDTALINGYYRGGGVDETYANHPAPAPNEGFQIYVGRIFIPANSEKEYFLKYDPHFTDAVEGRQVVTMMPDYMHHFVLYSFMQGGDQFYRAGLRPLVENSMENVRLAIGTASGLWDYSLPAGTAYFWDAGQIYDVNSHCINTTSHTVSADLYINVYTQPLGTAQHYMWIRNYVNDQISIPQDNQFHKFTVDAYNPTEEKNWKIWKLYTHTHKYGTKFDVFLRNADGTKGAQVYDGNYSYEHGFDMGYYRWGIDVTFRTWPDDSLFEVNPHNGFIYEATYKNTAGPDPVNWGMTSVDEMMAMGFHYIEGSDVSTDVKKVETDGLTMNIMPNPAHNNFMLSYRITNTKDMKVDLLNLVGEKVATLISGPQTDGVHTQSFETEDYGLSAGVYFLSIHVGNKTTTQKLVITN